MRSGLACVGNGDSCRYCANIALQRCPTDHACRGIDGKAAWKTAGREFVWSASSGGADRGTVRDSRCSTWQGCCRNCQLRWIDPERDRRCGRLSCRLARVCNSNGDCLCTGCTLLRRAGDDATGDSDGKPGRQTGCGKRVGCYSAGNCNRAAVGDTHRAIGKRAGGDRQFTGLDRRL